MSLENVKLFLEEVKESKELQEKLRALPADDVETAVNRCVAIAVEEGFEFTAQELKQVMNESAEKAKEEELSDAELEDVSGGGFFPPVVYPFTEACI